MSTHSRSGIRAATLVLVLCAVPGMVHGCSGPTDPAPPPGGGRNLALSFEQFEQRVQPVLVRHGCDAGGDCHGGGIRGSFELSPAGAKDARFDFEQTALQVWAAAPDRSPILTEPLADSAGGTPHGIKAFGSTGDADYQAIRAWIQAGLPR